MTLSDLRGMLPILVLSGSIIVMLLLMSFHRGHRLIAGTAILAFLAAFASLFMTDVPPVGANAPLFVLDGYARFFSGLFLLVSAAVALLARSYLGRSGGDNQPFYVLLVLATTGASVLTASENFAALFLGLEIMSVSLYALIAYLRDSPLCIEAAMKYLILAAISSAFLLFGVALIYAESGSLDFSIMRRIVVAGKHDHVMMNAAMGLLIVGFGFKLGAVPFHMWTPDVYEGAPVPVTSYIATVSKGAMFSLLFKFYHVVGGERYGTIALIILFISAASMVAGNILAIRQDNVKRILAYSSIAHIGYLLISLVAGSGLALDAVALYLATYLVTTIGAFGVVSVLSVPGRDAGSIEDFRGLFWSRPLLAAVFTTALLSLAGIPLTGGFWAKYYIAMTGMEAGLWPMVLLLVLNSAISLYYYLRIVSALFSAPQAEEGTGPAQATVSFGCACVLFIAAATLLWIGIYPQPIIDLIHSVM